MERRFTTRSKVISRSARSASLAGPNGETGRGFLLNGHPIFLLGPLDQGFWPDGLYTAPTDEALRSDLEMTKKLGFNLAQKHVKVEPARWYYWCDRLGACVVSETCRAATSEWPADRGRVDEA